jgi:Mg2+ and Co2+ transporter CorA
VINALRDHHGGSLSPSSNSTDDPSDTDFPTVAPPRKAIIPDRNPSPTSNTIAISRLTHTYLGDVLDHAILLTTSLTTMSASASSMISLIFNTMSVAQNETIKQLTYVTILFLPLTFLSGYFGMNFETMPEVCFAFCPLYVRGMC